MSTSANVMYYGVYQDGKLVNEHQQHFLCKNKVNEKLQQYQPAKNYTLELRYPDEDEVDHFTLPINLQDFLDGKPIKWEEDIEPVDPEQEDFANNYDNYREDWEYDDPDGLNKEG